jgi:hypothetical protein
MKSKSVIASLMAVVLTLLLALAAPDALAKGGGKGGGRGHPGSAGRASTFRSGGGRSHQFHSPRAHQRSHHHRQHNRFFFSFGASAFVPAWGWYDPYYYWGPSPYYPYYRYPYPTYYGYPYYGYPYYPNYWSDPCLTPDPSYAPYCPPTVDNPTQGYSVPPLDYPLPAPPPLPESGGEPGAQTPPQESTAPVSD